MTYIVSGGVLTLLARCKESDCVVTVAYIIDYCVHFTVARFVDVCAFWCDLDFYCDGG